MGGKDKTLFTEVLGENSTIKVIEFLIENRELDFGAGDISEETKLSRQSTYNVLYNLSNKKIVVKSRELRNKQMYKLNDKSRIVKQLEKLFDIILLAS